MYRKVNKYPKYKNKELEVKNIGVCELEEIGDWVEYYSFIKLGYKLPISQIKYSDVICSLKCKKTIVGYFMLDSLISEVNERKLMLYEFCVTRRKYSNDGKVLINYMVEFATKNGYQSIEIQKVERYSFFLNFIKRHYKYKEDEKSIYLLINNPHICSSMKYINHYKDDLISISDLYYLYDLNFNILRNTCKLKLRNNEYIIIDRKTLKVSFPSFVKLNKDEVIYDESIKGLIHLVFNYEKEITIDFDKNNPFEFVAYIDKDVYNSKSLQKLNSDIDYLFDLLEKGYNNIYSYAIDYDVNGRSFNFNIAGTSIEKFIERYSLNVESNASNLKEKGIERKKFIEFKEKMKNIKRFDFRMGNSFGGIKKFSLVFNEEVKLKSNGRKKFDIILDKDKIIKELSRINFANFRDVYNDNEHPILENAWVISLLFNDEIKEYRGLDSYPKSWPLILKFINKYSSFKE